MTNRKKWKSKGKSRHPAGRRPCLVAAQKGQSCPACPLCSVAYTSTWTELGKHAAGVRFARLAKHTEFVDANKRNVSPNPDRECPLCSSSEPNDPEAFFTLCTVLHASPILSPTEKHVRRNNFDKNSVRTFSGDSENAWAQPFGRLFCPRSGRGPLFCQRLHVV